MGRRLRFDVRKQKPSQKARKSRLTENDVKASLPTRPTMVDAGMQTESHWFSNDVEVQTEPEEIQPVTNAVGTQTEPDAIAQVHESAADAVKYCEGIVDAKYTPLIIRYDGVFKDATGME